MADLSGLIERCERATGPDRGLDAAIAIQFGVEHGPKEIVHYETRSVEIHDEIAPRYSSSVDSALALAVKIVKDEWPDVLHTALSSLSKKYSWHMTLAEPAQLTELPREIIIAALRALGSRHD